VVDELEGSDAHHYRLHWLLNDFPYHVADPRGAVVVETPAGPYCVSVASEGASAAFSLVRADSGTPRGWRAPYYGQRRPALSLAWTAHAPRVLFWTLFSPIAGRWHFDRGEARADFPGSVMRVWLNCSPQRSSLVERIVVAGAFSDELVIS
jgi:hypothetical protein